MTIHEEPAERQLDDSEDLDQLNNLFVAPKPIDLKPIDLNELYKTRTAARKRKLGKNRKPIKKKAVPKAKPTTPPTGNLF